MDAQLKIGVITVSDSRTAETDRSGPAVVEALRELGYDSCSTIVPDELEAIQRALQNYSQQCAAIFTTGGTGFGARDITPEATRPLLDRRADSLCELLRLKGLEHTPFSHLSRGLAGIIGQTLVVNLPGSPGAARQGIETLGPLLGPILANLRGGACPVHGDSR